MNENTTPGCLEPQPQQLTLEGDADNFQIGLLANYADSEETRFFLTPEACGVLTEAGMKIAMEAGAGIDISFSDDDYASMGVAVVDRREALKAETILSFEPLRVGDLQQMEEGSTVLCMMSPMLFDPEAIHVMLERKLTMGCLDNMYSHNEIPIFADIIDEIDGRAAIMYAQDHLSFLGGGKGVLLAGVAGINPCEVLVVGEGKAMVSAAKAAYAAGAMVTLMNNDISSLYGIQAECGQGITTLAIHPKVLRNKVRTADVIVRGTTARPFEFPRDIAKDLKETVYNIDLREIHPSVSVPRTVTMGLSNVLVHFLAEIPLMGGFDGMLANNEGVQNGMVTYRGQLVDKLVGSYLGIPSIDLRVMLAGRGHN